MSPRKILRATAVAAALATSVLPSLALAFGCAPSGNLISLVHTDLSPLELVVAPGSSTRVRFFALNQEGNAVNTATVEFRIPPGAGLSFVDEQGVPLPDPLRARVTALYCEATVPLIAAAQGVLSGSIEARFPFQPNEPIVIPVTAVARPKVAAIRRSQADKFDIVGAGARIAPMGATLLWEFGGLGARQVVFATNPPDQAVFPNGEGTISVPTDALGNAETSFSLKSVPEGGLTLYAQAENGLRADLARYSPVSAVAISPPEVPALFDYGDPTAHIKAKLAKFPCPDVGDADAAVRGRFVLAEGDAVTPVFKQDCDFDSIIAGLPHLHPGVHELRVGYRGDSHPTVYSTPVTVEVRPRAVITSAQGSVRLSLGNAGEQDDGTFRCTLAAPRAALTGEPGMPASLPAGVTAPWGLVHFELTSCFWESGWTLPPPAPPVTQRIVVVADKPLPANAIVWVHGTWVDWTGSVTEWREIPATLGEKSATFQLTANSSPTVAIGVRSSDPPNYQDLWWAGPQENGWGLSITQHGDRIFGALFIYDEAGAPRWVVMPGGKWDGEKRVFTADIYRPKGSPYYAYDASKLVPGAPIGTAQFEFTALDAMTMRFSMDGISGEKRLTRQLFGPRAVLPSVPQDGLWWGGAAQNGWGVATHQQGNSIFAIWFTYDAEGKTTWLVTPAALLFEPYKDIQADLYQTRGSPWLGTAYDPSKLEATVAGLTRFRQNSVSFVAPDGTVVHDIELQPF